MATSTQLRQALLDGQWDEQLRRLYGREDAVLARQKLRYAAALEQFEQYYGPGQQVRIYSAPGRAELGGNHTDHQHGYGLAAAVTLDTRAAVAKNADRRIRWPSSCRMKWRTARCGCRWAISIPSTTWTWCLKSCRRL